MNTPKIFGLPSADFVPSQISNEFGWNAISGNDEARRRRYHSTNQPPGAPPEPIYNALSPATLPGPQMNAVDQAGDRLGSAVSGGLTDIYNWANENSPRGDAQAIGDALHAADSPTPTGRDTYLGRVPGSGQETNIIDNAIAGAPGLWDTVSNRWFTPPTSTQPPPTTPTGRDTYLGPAPSTRQEPNVINGLIAGIPGALGRVQPAARSPNPIPGTPPRMCLRRRWVRPTSGRRHRKRQGRPEPTPSLPARAGGVAALRSPERHAGKRRRLC